MTIGEYVGDFNRCIMLHHGLVHGLRCEEIGGNRVKYEYKGKMLTILQAPHLRTNSERELIMQILCDISYVLSKRPPTLTDQIETMKIQAQHLITTLEFMQKITEEEQHV